LHKVELPRVVERPIPALFTGMGRGRVHPLLDYIGRGLEQDGFRVVHKCKVEIKVFPESEVIAVLQ